MNYIYITQIQEFVRFSKPYRLILLLLLSSSTTAWTQQPQNDEIENAITLTVNGAPTRGTTHGSNLVFRDFEANTDCYAASFINPEIAESASDVWYKFTATEAYMTLNVKKVDFSNRFRYRGINLRVFAVDGNTPINHNNASGRLSCVGGQHSHSPKVILEGIESNITYYVVVSSRFKTNFNISVSSISHVDTDGEGIQDYLDIDDDGDGILDRLESTNIAIGKSVTMSSEYGSYAAQNATDGDPSTIAHTTNASNKEWIQVDLGSVQDIDRIEIVNRLDCCQERLENVFVLVSQTPFGDNFDPANGPALFRYQLVGAETLGKELSPKIRGRYVRIQKPGQLLVDNYLNIAEIQVWKDRDTDGDGVVDRLDTDSDNDFIPDNIEGQTTLYFRASTGIDTDHDGWDNAYDSDQRGAPINPVDTDHDDIPDYLDTDSDNDDIPDIEERFKTNIKTPEDLPQTASFADGRAVDKDYRYNNANIHTLNFPVQIIINFPARSISVRIANSYNGPVTAKIVNVQLSKEYVTHTFTKNQYTVINTFSKSEWTRDEELKRYDAIVLTMGDTTKKYLLPDY